MEPQRVLEVAVLHDVEDRCEGLFPHGAGLRRHLDDGGADIIGVRGAVLLQPFAARDLAAGGLGGFQRLLHLVIGGLVDQRSDQLACFKRAADGDGLIGLHQTRNERFVDAVMDEQASQRRATLSGGSHGREGNPAEGEVEIGGRSDDRGIVAAEFKQRAREALCQARTDCAAHGGRAGRRDERHLLVVDQHFADLPPADQQGGKVLGSRIALGDVSRQRPLEDRLRGKCGQRGLLGGLPHRRVAADDRQGRVPRPYRDREIEGGDDPDDAQRMPGFHHAVLGALGCNRQAVELAGETHRKIADVDHFLDFAQAFGGDLADLDGDQATESLLGRPQLLAEEANEFAPLGSRHEAPREEGLMCLFDCRRCIRRRDLGKPADLPPGNRRADRKGATGIALGLDAEIVEDVFHVLGEIEIGKRHVSPSGYRIGVNVLIGGGSAIRSARR